MVKQHNLTSSVPTLTEALGLFRLQNNVASRSNPLMKKVTFSTEEYNEVRTFVTDDNPNEELWFSHPELQAIKAETRKESREWRRMEYDKLLNDSLQSDESNRYGELSQYDIQFLINTFCSLQGNLYQRGLERFCSQNLGEGRSDIKSLSKFTVLEAQRQYKSSGTFECVPVNLEQLTEAIAVKYNATCKDAALFARRMAIGDEYAVTTDHSAEQIQDILNQCQSRRQLRRMSGYSAASSTASSIVSRHVAVHRGDRRLASEITNTAPGPVSRKAPWQTKELYAAIA